MNTKPQVWRILSISTLFFMLPEVVFFDSRDVNVHMFFPEEGRLYSI